MHGFRSIYHLLDHIPALHMGQDTTRYRGFPRRSRFWLVSRFGLSFWSRLDTHDENGQEPSCLLLASIFFVSFSSTATVFWSSKAHTYTTRPIGVVACISRGLPPSFLVLDFSHPVAPFSFLIITSLPRRYLETLQLSRDTPGMETHFGNGCRGSRALGAASTHTGLGRLLCESPPDGQAWRGRPDRKG